MRDNPAARRFYWRWEKELLALLPSEGATLLAGLSGGGDSVVLARLLLESRDRGICRVLLAHINHGLRAEADAEEAFVRNLARDWELALHVRAVDPAPLIAAGRSLEEAARLLRLAALREIAAQEGALITLGHHMDDQAETVLLRILRGTGPRGLGAMAPHSPARDVPPVIRPLLTFRRAQLREFARRTNLSWLEDSSNRDRARLRNRIRHDLIPHLAAEFNPRIVESLADLAHWQRAESGALDAEVAKLSERARRASKCTDARILLDCAVLRGQAPALATRVIWLAYQELAGPEATLAGTHMRQLSALLSRAGADQAEVHLPHGLRARREGDQITLEAHVPRPEAPAGETG